MQPDVNVDELVGVDTRHLVLIDLKSGARCLIQGLENHPELNGTLVRHRYTTSTTK